MRIGHGVDIHKFGGCRPLVIGGVRIPFVQGIHAHSDGDVMIHALIDAILGAACCGDIGQLFPDTDHQYSNINSRQLLKIVWKKIVKLGYSLSNIDITLILEYPKIVQYIFQMRNYISQDLNCAQSSINIKATTTEGLGYIGRSEGIACVVMILLNMTQKNI